MATPPPPEKSSSSSLPLWRQRLSPLATGASKEHGNNTSNSLVRLLEKEDFEPTEVDLTETEHTSDNFLGWHSSHSANASPLIKALPPSPSVAMDKRLPSLQEKPYPVSMKLAPLEHQEIKTDAATETTTPADEEFTRDGDPVQPKDGLFTMETLVDLLHETNHPAHADPFTRRRRLKKPDPALQVEDLTHILAHVNMSEAANVPPRWDVIYQLAYGGGASKTGKHKHASPPSSPQRGSPGRRRSSPQKSRNDAINSPLRSAADNEMVEGMHVLDADSRGSARLLKPATAETQEEVLLHIDRSVLESSSSSAAVGVVAVATDQSLDYNQYDNDQDDTPSLTLSDIFPNARPTLSDDKKINLSESDSLSLGDLVPPSQSPADAASGFTLEASTFSVASSVTWYEGADITEVEVSSSSEGESGGDAASFEHEDSDASMASTPPPMDILLGPVVVMGDEEVDDSEPENNDNGDSSAHFFDLSFDEVDSLERVYQRRRRRRYDNAAPAATAE